MNDCYKSPFSERYAADYMLKLFSPDTRYGLWRRLWLSLAKAEQKQGLNISDEQIEELEKHLDDIDYDCVKKREREVKHDVMAHIYAFGVAAPKAAGIIHLGATSCFVTDNADLIIYKRALSGIRNQLLKTMRALSEFADKYKGTPTLAYTHYQPAQFTTVGKRAALWLYNLESDLKTLDFTLSEMKFLGCRGTTGTEASFSELFSGDTRKIDEMNESIARDFGFESTVDVCGQTYPRKTDSAILNALSSIAQSAYKAANDIRLLQHDGEIEEPFASSQVGSSAMAYKRNPIRCERICSLSRYLIFDALNAHATASEQWLERTLDDSANRRISLPEGFLCASAVLSLCEFVFSGLKVNEIIISDRVKKQLPFIATENLLMDAAANGGDRQKLHEIIRERSMRAVESMRAGGENRLIEDLLTTKEFAFAKGREEELLNPEKYIGRCEEQVEKYIGKITPLFADIKEDGKTEII